MSILKPNFVPGLIKAAGHIGGYLINKIETTSANKYNEPRAKVQRLRDAGLPYQAAEAFSNEHVGVPDTSGFGQAGEGLSGYLDQAKTSKEIAILDEQILYWAHKVGLEGLELALSSAERDFLLDNGYVKDGEFKNWFTHAKEYEMEMKKASAKYETHKAEIAAIEEDFKKATNEDEKKIVAEKLRAFLINNDIGDLNKENIEKQNKARNTMIDTMSKGGLNFIEALTLMILQNFSASGGTGGFKIGN